MNTHETTFELINTNAIDQYESRQLTLNLVVNSWELTVFIAGVDAVKKHFLGVLKEMVTPTNKETSSETKIRLELIELELLSKKLLDRYQAIER